MVVIITSWWYKNCKQFIGYLEMADGQTKSQMASLSPTASRHRPQGRLGRCPPGEVPRRGRGGVSAAAAHNVLAACHPRPHPLPCHPLCELRRVCVGEAAMVVGKRERREEEEEAHVDAMLVKYARMLCQPKPMPHQIRPNHRGLGPRG